jgi:hypothetical protein
MMEKLRKPIQWFLIVCRSFLILTIAAGAFSTGLPSSHLNSQKPSEDQPVRLNATLVQVPAIVTDRNGKFVTDLSQNDFTVYEEGKRQDISFFAAVKQPFNAVLVLDTSNSAQDRLKAIQHAAIEFTSHLA